MSIKSSSNCCINIWRDALGMYYDAYIVFPEYADNEPLKDGTWGTVEAVYKDAIETNSSCESIKLYIEEALDEKGIEYVCVFVLKKR